MDKIYETEIKRLTKFMSFIMNFKHFRFQSLEAGPYFSVILFSKCYEQ